jgi:alkylation response protein AidB-like acyl-CoA dehydrogenase
MRQTLPVQSTAPSFAPSEAQKEARLRFRYFVQEYIAPFAGEWDRAERVPLEVIDELRARGYLGAPLPGHPGGAMDPITYGLLTEEIARGCSSTRSLLTVHDMVSLGFYRWGSRAVKEEFGDAISSGRLLCALALSEPEAGSDAAGIKAEARASDAGYVLTGKKMDHIWPDCRSFFGIGALPGATRCIPGSFVNSRHCAPAYERHCWNKGLPPCRN